MPRMAFTAPRLPATSLLAVLLLSPIARSEGFPDWAFPGCPPRAASEAPSPKALLSVSGSRVHFTAQQIGNWYSASDWFPDEHPKMPAIVALGHTPHQPACGYCHLPDGSGRPENARIAGLPAAYIARALESFKAGERHPAQGDWFPASVMVRVSADLSGEEIAKVAEYFSTLPSGSSIEVIERATVPNHSTGCFAYLPQTGAEVAQDSSIMEMPKDPVGFERRDPHSRYLAYVPVGSLERGRQLAMGTPKTHGDACATCHGEGLRGGSALPGPPIAGRFPGYLFRQLYGFKSGARAGEAAKPMQPVVRRLSMSDMVDLAAFAASLPP